MPRIENVEVVEQIHIQRIRQRLHAARELVRARAQPRLAQSLRRAASHVGARARYAPRRAGGGGCAPSSRL